MEKPISVGDLVVVARPSECVGGNDDMGRVFTVLRIWSFAEVRKAKCVYCGKPSHLPGLYAESGTFSYPFARLKRIPPLSELEGERTQEDIREPA